MLEWLRKIPHPTYGTCGGARKDCSIRREKLDPLDQIFFDHDNELDLANTPEQRQVADRKLNQAIRALTEEDYKKISMLQWKWPFFRRWYAKRYAKQAARFING